MFVSASQQQAIIRVKRLVELGVILTASSLIVLATYNLGVRNGAHLNDGLSEKWSRFEIVLECQRLSTQTIDKFRDLDGKRTVWDYQDCKRELMDASGLLPATMKVN